MTQVLLNGHYFGERSLFGSKDVELKDAIFDEGESPLKESEDVTLKGCSFKWKYPLWYCKRKGRCRIGLCNGLRQRQTAAAYRRLMC